MQTRSKRGGARWGLARQTNILSAVGTVLSAMIVATATMAALPGLASAQEESVPGYDQFSFSYERMAFDAADTDGKGLVSLPELARDAAVGFATLDKDGSLTLTPAELGPHDPAQFKRVDTNGDGVLSFQEVMANKSRAFKEGDKDKNGGLSFEEMVTVVETEVGAPK